MGHPPLTIQKMQEIAESRGGRCLSKVYRGILIELHWECAKGHKWWAMPNNIISNNTWCPICAGNVRLTIEEMQDIAESRGGRCLSKKYINVQTKLKWQCSKGHRWQATPSNIKSGTWCPTCAGKK